MKNRNKIKAALVMVGLMSTLFLTPISSVGATVLPGAEATMQESQNTNLSRESRLAPNGPNPMQVKLVTPGNWATDLVDSYGNVQSFRLDSIDTTSSNENILVKFIVKAQANKPKDSFYAFGEYKTQGLKSTLTTGASGVMNYTEFWIQVPVPKATFSNNSEIILEPMVASSATSSSYSSSFIKIKNPLWQSKLPVSLVAGDNRYSTAAKLSQTKYSTADTVVLVNSEAIADGLSVTPLAYLEKAPILLTEQGRLTPETQNEIARLRAKKVILTGGSDVVGVNVENKLREMGISNIVRLAGDDRCLTSLEIVKYIEAKHYSVDKLIVAGGYAEPDALSAASLSAIAKMPIILTEKDRIEPAMEQWLNTKQIKETRIIGETDVVSENVANKVRAIPGNVVKRLGGKDRYATNAAIYTSEFTGNINKVYVAKGYDLVDALSAGPIAALDGAPVILAGNDLTPEQIDALYNKKGKAVVRVGGGIPDITVNRICENLYEGN